MYDYRLRQSISPASKFTSAACPEPAYPRNRPYPPTAHLLPTKPPKASFIPRCIQDPPVRSGTRCPRRAKQNIFRGQTVHTSPDPPCPRPRCLASTRATI